MLHNAMDYPSTHPQLALELFRVFLDRIPAKPFDVKCVIRKGFQQLIVVVVDTPEILLYPHPCFPREHPQDVYFLRSSLSAVGVD